MPERFFKLSNYPGSLGLSCNEDGVALAGVSLTSCDGKYVRPRSRAELQILMARAYGVEADTSRLEAGLSAIAKALNTGEIARAMAAAVLLRLPDLDWEGAVRIAQAEEILVKYSEDQPRDCIDELADFAEWIAIDAELLTPSPVWKLGWAARGQIIDKFLVIRWVSIFR